MPSIEELVVRARPEGLAETSQGFNQMQDDLEDTEAQMDDSADAFGGMASKWKGALGAITAGLAVAVGGLLNQVPILGESMGSLQGIVDSVAFKIDQDLRPALTGFNEDLRDTQTDVQESEGTFDALSTAVDGVQTAFDNLAVSTIQDKIKDVTGIEIPENWLEFGWDVITMDLDGVLRNGKQLIKNFKSDYRDVAKQLGNAVLNGVGNLKTGIMEKASGVSQAAKNIADDIKEKISDGALDAFTWGKNIVIQLADGISQRVSRATTQAKNVYTDVKDWFTDLVDDAVDWGEDLIEEFAQGIKNKTPDTKSVLKSLAQKLRDYLPSSPAKQGPLADLDQTGPGLVSTFTQGITANLDAVDAAGNRLGGAAQATGGMQGGGNSPRVYIDGRNITSETGRYRRDSVSRRGRNG